MSGPGSGEGLRAPDIGSHEQNKKYTVAKTTDVQNVSRNQGEKTRNLKKLVRVIQKIGNANAFISSLENRDVGNVIHDINVDFDNAKRGGSHGRLVKQDKLLSIEDGQCGEDLFKVIEHSYDSSQGSSTNKRGAKIRRNVSFDLDLDDEKSDDSKIKDKQFESGHFDIVIRSEKEHIHTSSKRRHSVNISRKDEGFMSPEYNSGSTRNEVSSTGEFGYGDCESGTVKPDMQKVTKSMRDRPKSNAVQHPLSTGIPYLLELKEKISSRASLLDDEYNNADYVVRKLGNTHAEKLPDVHRVTASQQSTNVELQPQLTVDEKATLNELESYITRGGPVSILQYVTQSGDEQVSVNAKMPQLTRNKQLDTFHDSRVKMESRHHRRDRHSRRELDRENVADSREDDELDGEWTNANDEFTHKRRVNDKYDFRGQRGINMDHHEYKEKRNHSDDDCDEDGFNDGPYVTDANRRRIQDRSSIHHETDVNRNDSLEREFDHSEQENHPYPMSSPRNKKSQKFSDREQNKYEVFKTNGHNENIRTMSNDSQIDSVITDIDEVPNRQKRPNVIVTSASVASTDESDGDKLDTSFERKREHRDESRERGGVRSYSAGRNRERKQGSADIHRKYQSQINLSRKDRDGYESDVNKLERCVSHHFTPSMTRRNRMNESSERPDTLDMDDVNAPLSRASSMANIAEIPRRVGEQKMPKSKMGSFQDFSPIRHAQSTTRVSTAKDGPLSLTDAYGSMETNDTHTGHALTNSANHLSESMTSLSNRHAPMTSPSRQGTLNKQQSLQSSHSELNGDHRHEEGIKFERLKNLPEEELMVKIKEIIGHMERLEDYHRGDGMRIQKMLGDMYWDYTHMREMIGDCMADNGYAVVSMTMLKTLNSIGIFKNDDVWFPTYYTYNTMWNFTDASSKLAKALSENDAVRLLTLNCGHKPYINAIHSKNVYYVIKASLSILHNIARNSGMKHLFDENKTSETIMPFLESEDEMLKILATLTIANIVDEEENKTIIAESGTIHDIVNWIEKALSLPRRRYKGFTPQELTEGLNKLAVNDANKMRIVDEGALQMFLQMLQHDDIREQSSAARIVWTLSFDKDVRQKINENTELVSVMEKLTDSTNKSLQTNCSGALWIIRGDNEVNNEKRPKTNKNKSHVFLSYAWSDKDIVLNIRDRLRAEGYAIWIDIEKMGKATLETMTEAIENSAVVLVCMSEKYKQSPNCRTEAEYTFQLKKDYIPLMMQKKYRPDGWVGTILGAKLYFDFSGKYPFDKSFQGLLKELRGRGKVTPNTTPGDSNGTPVHHMPLNSAILNMGQEELIKWLRNVKLTECIPAFMEFDGRLLMQLKIMRTEAPEFFYQCLEKRLNMSLIEILKFTRALEELQ